jgi:hypothetical protein
MLTCLQHAVGGSNAMDIWEGVYLDGEKVAIKMMRAVHSNEKNVNVSRTREQSETLTASDADPALQA